MGICLRNGSTAECGCKAGFKLMADGRTCVPVHPCEMEGKGGCSHICNKDGNAVRCSCPPGFLLEEDGKTCEEGRSQQF